MISTIRDASISVVIQGPIRPSTSTLIAKLRVLLPCAEIILSTWDGEKLDGIDYDYLVLSDQPGSYIQHKRTKTKNNLNRLLRSSIAGIKKAKRKYLLKVRSDIVLDSVEFLNSFNQYPSTSEYTVVKRKIIVPLLFSRIFYHGQATPFHLSDWAMFGLTEDIRTLFLNIAEVEEPVFTEWFPNKSQNKSPYGATTFRFSPEQYIFYSFYRNHFNRIQMEDASDNHEYQVDESNKFIVSNFIVVDYKGSGFRLDKYPASTNEVILGREYLTLWNRFNYEKYYSAYCDPNFSCDESLIEFKKLSSIIDRVQFEKHLGRCRSSQSILEKTEELLVSIILYMKFLLRQYL